MFSLKTRVTEKQEDYENCKVYKKGEYESCLQSEIQQSFSQIINCTPPWFTSDSKPVKTFITFPYPDFVLPKCGPLRLKDDERNYIFNLFYGIYSDLYNSKCSSPCFNVEYEALSVVRNPITGELNNISKEIRAIDLHIMLHSGGFETYIRFDPVVDIYKSKLEVNIFSLFIRLGGIIGFCKNLLWVLLFSGTIVSLWKKIIPQAYLASSTSVSVLSVSEASK